MANKKITELNEATSISNNDWLVMVDVANDETKKIHAGEVGGNIPIQDTAPAGPEENDLWIDTSEPEEMQEAIVNEYSESTNETYSCDYTNNLFKKFNLSTITSYGPNDMTTSGCTLDSDTSITIAKNSDGSICKIYGNIRMTKSDQTATITIANTGILPDSQISINPSGFEQGQGNSRVAVRLQTDGSIVLVSFGAGSGATITTSFIPFIIFVKGF